MAIILNMTYQTKKICYNFEQKKCSELKSRILKSWNRQKNFQPHLEFTNLTAQRELLRQNDEKISPLVQPYGFYENSVSSTGLLWKS